MHRHVHCLESALDDDALALFCAFALDCPRRRVCKVLVRTLDGFNGEFTRALNVESRHRGFRFRSQHTDAKYLFRGAIRDDTSAILLAKVRDSVHQVPNDVS